MKKLRIILLFYLAFFVLTFSISVVPKTAEAAEAAEAARLPMYEDDSKYPDIRYTVGMYYTAVWTDSNGHWIKDPATNKVLKPGSYVSEQHMSFTYAFNFPGRKVKRIDVEVFDIGRPDGHKIFKKARGREWNEYSDAVTDKPFKPRRVGQTGIGSSLATATVQTDGTLSAPDPEDLTKGGDYAKNVVGLQYYFPVLFTVELEPLQGQAIIKHFTKDGRSLNGIDGFRDVTEVLKMNEKYHYTHPPDTAKYKYLGFKKSTVDPPPATGGSYAEGDENNDPNKFTYDGKFSRYYINFYYDPIGDTDPDPPDRPDPSADCTTPTPAQNKTGQALDPFVSAAIQADHPNNAPNQFDAIQGIPTSENLYTQAIARNYLFKNKFVQMVGKCTFKVPVSQTFNLKWTDEEKATGPDGKETTVKTPQSESETKDAEITVERPYSFWVVDNLEVYKIDKATLQNYALPDGSVELRPHGYSPPNYTVSANNHGIAEVPSPKSITLPTRDVSGGNNKPSVPSDMSDFKSAAEREVGKVKVRNDALDFESRKIMDGAIVEESGLTPGDIPQPIPIGDRVLFKDRNLVERTKVNKANQPSTGTIDYALMPNHVNGGENKTYPISGINSVTVHTPTVNYSQVSDDAAHNQKTKPNYNRRAVILDRPFTVTIPTRGKHVNLPGYGNRDYAKYIQNKQVRFPFDVYLGHKSQFYGKGSWISIPVSQEVTEFFLPVWVDEGNYSVEFRSIAENSPHPDYASQPNANLNLANHVAVDTIDVEVIGRLYDFHITDIADYAWEQVFRPKKGSKEHTGNTYWVGKNGIDGALRGNQQPFVLPVRQGSHPVQGFKNVSVKTGYHFKFDLKTKGNMFGDKDGIRITPAFYFIDTKGKNRQEVDLYYHAEERKFIRIGSSFDVQQKNVTLQERLRNVSPEALRRTAETLYDLNPESRALMSKAEYVDQWMKRSHKPTYVGGYSFEILPKHLRTFIGETQIPNGVNPARAMASIQQWYGEYSIPASPYAVTKGTDLEAYGRSSILDEKAPIFLRNGYIIVNFNIETIRDGRLNDPHLQYIYGPLNNQWQMEGYSREFIDPYDFKFTLKDGDVIFYHGNFSSYDDFRAGGTH